MATSTLAEAVAWAERTRNYRAALVARCADGLQIHEVHAEVEVAPAVASGDVAFDADELGEMRLLPLLEAMAHMGGKVASRRAMAAAGLSEAVVLRDIGADAWHLLEAHEAAVR